MKESDLKQRVFDKMFSALTLMSMLDRVEMLDIAAGLLGAETTDGDERELFAKVAKAVIEYANAPAQA